MKNLLIVFSFITCSVFAQNYSLQYSVQLTALVDESKPSITIQWPLDANANRYTIYRKLRNSSNWGGAIANFTKDSTSYVDSKIEVGKAYEYRVTRSNLNDGSVASGFIYAGIKYPSNYNKGSILLLIDSRFQSSLKAEIDQYSSDLINEGWNPIRFVVPDAWTSNMGFDMTKSHSRRDPKDKKRSYRSPNDYFNRSCKSALFWQFCL